MVTGKREWKKEGSSEREFITAVRREDAQTHHWHSSTWTSKRWMFWDLELQFTMNTTQRNLFVAAFARVVSMEA